MGFFNRQAIDEIGVRSVKLQKIILFLMIVNFCGYFIFNLLTWLLTTFTLSVLIVGFCGAYRRSDVHLRFYGGASIALVMLGLVVGIMMISITPDQPDQSDMQPKRGAIPDPNNAMPLRQPNPTPDMLPLHDPNSPALSLNTPQVPQDPQVEPQPKVRVGVVILSSFALIFGLVVFALKLASIVMAFRIAHMLRMEKVALTSSNVLNQEPAIQEEMVHQGPMSMGLPQIVYVPVPMNPQQGLPTPFAFPQQGQPMFFNPYLVKPNTNSN